MLDNCATAGEKPSSLTSLVQTLKPVLTVAVSIFNASLMECYNTAPRGASQALTHDKQEVTHLEKTGEKHLGGREQAQAFGTCDTIFTFG